MSNILKITEKYILPYGYYLYVLGIFISVALMNIMGILLFTLLLLVRLYRYIKFKEEFLPQTPINNLILILVGIEILAILLSPVLAQAKRPLFFYIAKTRTPLMFLFNLGILKYYLDYKKVIKFIISILPIIVVLAIFDSLSGSKLLKLHFETNFTWPPRRITGAYIAYITYAPIHYMIFLFILPFIFYVKRTSTKVFLISVAILEALSLIFSGSRTVAIAIPLGLLTEGLIFFRIKSKIWKYYLVLFITLITGIVLAISASSYLKSRFNYTKNNIHNFGDIYRHHLWTMNFDIFTDYPILGVGNHLNYERTFINKYKEKHSVPSREMFYGLAHDTYIQFLAGSGIIGFSIFLLLIYNIIRSLIFLIKYRNKTSNETLFLTIALSGSLSALFASTLVDTPFRNSLISAIIYIIFAIVMLNYTKLKESY